jgi:hypothetical protein
VANLARNNGTDGLFLCWRVRHGVFANNQLEDNGRYGISIGHKDSDNRLEANYVRRNGGDGIHFRDETFGMAAHRNRLKDNIIEDNGTNGPAAGIRVRGETDGLIFDNNQIRDTRSEESQTQTVGILIEEQAGSVTLKENQITAQRAIEDRREK